MRIWLHSDWHLEHGRLAEGALVAAGVPEADVCVVPGDLHTAGEAVRVLAEVVAPHMPVLYVPGNHDFYGRDMPEARRLAREAADSHPGVTLLDPGAAVVGGVRFVGATLWTDYALLGEAMAPTVMSFAAGGLNDHRLIGTGGRRWSVHHAAQRHREELEFLDGALSEPFDGPTVVVTHHAPHPLSIHPKYATGENALLNGAFASDLSAFIERHGPGLWVHGHVHDGFDYTVGRTRVVANPRGYQVRRGEGFGPENALFDPMLVLEV